MDAWKCFWRHFGTGRQPGQTSLTFICDVEDTLTGSRILDPLLKYLPSLRSCTIRLGRSPGEKDLARIARDTALILTRSQQNTKPFPFGRLPRELQLHILKCTHLCPPELAGYSRDYTNVRVETGRLVRGNHIWSVARTVSKCCGECGDASFDCCCIDTHASFSPRCTCRALPMALFHVDRETRLLALEILYTTNRFALWHDDLGASLKFPPTSALPLLRNITLGLTPAQCYHWTGQEPTPAHPAWHLEEVVENHFPNCSPYTHDPTEPSYHDTFKTIMSTLASSGSTPITLELDLRATRAFAVEFRRGSDDHDENRFRWTYELYRDVATAVWEAFGPDTSRRIVKTVKFRLGTFTDLEGWLEREVLRELFNEVLQPEGTRMVLSERVPKYHQP